MTFFSVCYCHLGEGKASGTGLMKDLFTYRRITMLQIREQKCLCLIILIVFWWQVSFISLSSCSVILPEDTFFESFTKLILCCFCFLFFWHIRGKSIFNNDTSTLIKYIINRRKYVPQCRSVVRDDVLEREGERFLRHREYSSSTNICHIQHILMEIWSPPTRNIHPGKCCYRNTRAAEWRLTDCRFGHCCDGDQNQRNQIKTRGGRSHSPKRDNLNYHSLELVYVKTLSFSCHCYDSSPISCPTT